MDALQIFAVGLRRHTLRHCLVALYALLALCGTLEGATFTTKNFVVTAPSEKMARQVAGLAEQYRVQLAQEWLGQTLPNWKYPCKVRVQPGTMGASGETTFNIGGGHVYDWRMNVRGPYERILDSVLPHEVSHTIFASYFRRPLPRWADEGAATLVENESERRRLSELLNSAIKSGRRYHVQKLVTIMEYPGSHRDTLTLYAQGYSLADYLTMQKGKAEFLRFLQTAHERDWQTAFHKHYGISDLAQFDRQWLGWVTAGSPRKTLPEGVELASNDQTPSRSRTRSVGVPGAVVRGQNPRSASVGVTPRVRQPNGSLGQGMQAPAPQPQPARVAIAPTNTNGPRDRERLSLPIIRSRIQSHFRAVHD